MGVFVQSGRFGVAAFSPLDLSPILWLDASDAATITSSGGLVSAWNDKSGTANHLASSGVNRPTTGATTFNSLNVIDFGTVQSNYLDTTTMSGMSGKATFTALVVAKMANSHAYARIISTAASTGGVDYNATTTAAMLLRDNSNQAVSGYRNNAATSIKAVTYGSPFCASSVWDGATHTVYVDGAAGTPTATSGSNWSVTHLRLGFHTAGGTSDWLVGSIAEVIITGTALGSTDRAAAEAYLKAKWGV